MRDEGKVNILLVDDRPDKLLAMEAVLEELNENIVRAYNGREALRCVMNQDFAVILLDVNMPGMDGFETAQLIRQRKNTEHVPIIFVTAYGDDDHRSRGYSLGAVDYIQTPIVPDVLKTKVSVFADLYKKSEQVHRQARWLRERATQLHKLTEACLSINSALSLERILGVMTETARDIFGAHVASTILLRDGNWSHPTIVSSASGSKCELVAESAAAQGGRDARPGLQVQQAHALVAARTGGAIFLARIPQKSDGQNGSGGADRRLAGGPPPLSGSQWP